MKWSSKEAGFFFNSDNSIIEMYKRRFQAFFLYNTAKADSLRDVDLSNPSPDKMQACFDGTEDLIRYGESVEGDAAVLTYLWLSTDKDKTIDYQSLDKLIGDKEIDEKFIAEASKQEVYKSCLSKLEKLQEKGEKDAKEEISKGGKVQFTDRDKSMIASTMGQDTIDSVNSQIRKYGSWSKINDSGATEDFLGSKKGKEFWGKSKYSSVGQAVGEAKDKIYDQVMSSQTNILTAPLKLFFFGLHELLNPNSSFRSKALPWLKRELNKIRDNQKLKSEYKRLGVELDKIGSDEQTTTVDATKTYTKTVQILQRELAKGYDFKKDLAAVQTKKENSVKEAKEPQNGVDQEQKLDDLATAGDDENADVDKVQNAEDNSVEDIQEQIANVVMRYNCLIYIMMRAFAGTFGNIEAYKLFSFKPFTLEKKEEKQEEHVNPNQDNSDNTDAKNGLENISDSDRAILNQNGIKSSEDVMKISKGLRTIKALQLKKAGISDETLKAIGLKESALTLKSLCDSYLIEEYDGRKENVVGNSVSGADGEDESVQNQKPEQAGSSNNGDSEADAKAKVTDETYLLTMTNGADHWIRRDRMMNILITRTPTLRQEVIRDAKYSTFFVYVNLMELFLKEYQQYILAVESNPNFEKFRNSTISLSQIKDLRLVQTTTNLQKVIRYMFQNVVTDKGLRTQLMRSMNPIWIFRKITSIRQFLTIRNMDFTNMKKWISMILPRLERVMRTSNVQCEIKKDAIDKIFRKDGIPFSYIMKRKKTNKTESDKSSNGDATKIQNADGGSKQ